MALALERREWDIGGKKYRGQMDEQMNGKENINTDGCRFLIHKKILGGKRQEGKQMQGTWSSSRRLLKSGSEARMAAPPGWLEGGWMKARNSGMV